MRLNLSGAQRVIEDLMLDECEITRDVEGTGDDVWNPATGTYTPPPSDLEFIYSGPCMISSRGGGADQEQGGQYLRESPYMITLPLDAPELIKKDKVLVTLAHRDPDLFDQEFSIDEPLYSTYAVSRRASMHLIIHTPGAA